MALDKFKENLSAVNQQTAFVPFILAIFLIIIEILIGYKVWSLSFEQIVQVWRINGWDWLALAAGLGLFVLIISMRIEHIKLFLQDWIFYTLMTALLLFFIFTGGPAGIIHIAVTMFIVMSIPMENKTFKKELGITVLLCTVDFIGYGLAAGLLSFNNNIEFLRYVLNLNLAYVCVQGLNFQKPGLLRGIFMLIIGAMIFSIVFYVIDSALYYNAIQRASPQEILEGIRHFYEEPLNNAGSFFRDGFLDFRALISGNSTWWDTSPGEEEPVENPQGIELEALDQGDRPFRTGQSVYGTIQLEARTLEEPIKAQAVCYTEVEADEYGEDIIVMGKVNGREEPYSIEVISYSQHTVRCSFDTLPPGDYEIVFNVTFDYASEIRQKLYLMNRNRLMNDQISLENKGQDSSSQNVLREIYDITDSDPEAIYTSGPLILGIGTDAVPIDIAQNEVREAQFSVSAENDWSKGGMVTSFNNIYLKIPVSFGFSDLQDSCDEPLSITTEQEEAGYKTFRLELTDRFTNIDDKIGVSCIMEIPYSSLEPVPVTTKYIKSYVQYTYVLQEEVDVEVEENPTADPELYQGEDSCCEVDYGTTVRYYHVVDEEECNNYNSDTVTAALTDPEMC